MKCVVWALFSFILIVASEPENVPDASADESENRYVGYEQNKLGPGYRLVYIGRNLQRPAGENAYGIQERGHVDIANYKYRFQNYDQQLGYNLGHVQNQALGLGQQSVDLNAYGVNLGYPGVYGVNQNLGDRDYVYNQGYDMGYETKEERPEDKIYRVMNNQYTQYNRGRGRN